VRFNVQAVMSAAKAKAAPSKAGWLQKFEEAAPGSGSAASWTRYYAVSAPLGRTRARPSLECSFSGQPWARRADDVRALTCRCCAATSWRCLLTRAPR